VAVLSTSPLPRTTLSDRIALSDRRRRPSRLLTGTTGGGTTTALYKLTAPLVRDAVWFVERVIWGGRSVERRLTAIGSPLTVDQFRIEQCPFPWARPR
jgi:tight adherence protein C